jgi:ApbE superfamily uncharacterized protein (UPF0280 family)
LRQLILAQFDARLLAKVCWSPASVGACIAFARAEAALLTDHASIALAVADALVARRTILGTEIITIIAREPLVWVRSPPPIQLPV